jgi:hypothetical protein
MGVRRREENTWFTYTPDPTGLYLAKAALGQGLSIVAVIVNSKGGDLRAERRVLQYGRLDFTEGPPMAVK